MRRVAPEGPFFSVVVAAYNPGERVIPTLRSALDQTYPLREIIVVGDGCSDRTGEIIQSAFGDRVRWTNLERNTGSQSEPNNEGNRLAMGTHVAYLGHDDIWSPNHLAALAATISLSDSDFAVSGAIFHPPEGSDLYSITGLFDDGAAAATEFYPPSSFAHRRAIREKIGGWSDPMEIVRPVDCDFLLRAVAAGCSFASTRRITVHKFAAGQRYLSYRFPSSAEQEAMLASFADPLFETKLLTAILARAAAGAKMRRSLHGDYSEFVPGQRFRAARRSKGLDGAPPLAIDRSTCLPLDTGPAALDWEAAETDPKHGLVRWSGRNPNPTYFLNVQLARPFVLRIRVAAFADPAVASALQLRINGRETAFGTETSESGASVLTVRPDLPLPIADGLRIVFETHRPGSPLPPKAIAGRRFALAGFELLLVGMPAEG